LPEQGKILPMNFSRDPLPWFALIRDLVAFGVASGTGIILWYRKRSARFWPMAYGRVEGASSFQNSTLWLTDISYSYRVADEYYSGQFQIKARSERKADETVARWKDQNVGVRYSPKNPAISVVRMEDQASLHPEEFQGH